MAAPEFDFDLFGTPGTEGYHARKVNFNSHMNDLISFLWNKYRDAFAVGALAPLINVAGTAQNITADWPIALESIDSGVAGNAMIELIPPATNTGPDPMLTINSGVSGSIGPFPIKRPNGAAMKAGDLVAGRSFILRRRGAQWRLAAGDVYTSDLNAVETRRAIGVQAAGIIPLSGAAMPTTDNYTASFTNSSWGTGVSLGAESSVELIVPTTNTGAATLTVAGDETRPIQNVDGGALAAGDLVAGRSYILRRRGGGGAVWRIVAGGTDQSVLRQEASNFGVVRLVNLSGTGDSFTADLSGGVPLSAITKVEYIPKSTNTGPVVFSVAGSAAMSIYSSDGMPLQADYFKVGRSYLLVRRSTLGWRVLAGGVDKRDLDTGLASKADLSNSGKVFPNRTAAVNAGQSALPSSLGMIYVQAGKNLQIRAPAQSTNDPLFATSPFWGIVSVQNSAWAVANAGMVRLNTIPTSSGPYQARLAEGISNYVTVSDLTSTSKLEYIPNRDSSESPSILIEGDVERSIFASDGSLLPAGAMKAGKSYILVRRGEFFRLLFDDSSSVPADLVDRLDGVELGLQAEIAARQAAVSSEAGLRQSGDSNLQEQVDGLREDVDAVISGTRIVGDWDASAGSFPVLRPDGEPIQSGDQWNVTVSGTVDGVDFAPGDILTALVSGGGSSYLGNWSRRAGTATQADQVSTSDLGVSVQDWIDRFVKKTSLQWDLSDYVDDENYHYAGLGDVANQDELAVTSSINDMFNEVIDWWSASPGRFVQVIGKPITLAINDEIFDEYFAQKLWAMGNPLDDNRFEILANGLEFQAKNWLARAAVRTSGFWAAQGIIDPVPKVMFRWEQSSSRQFSPQITGRLTLSGEEIPATDPIGVKTMSMNMAFFDKLRIRDFRNTGMFNENFFNSGVGDLDIIRCGYQPTDFGSSGFLPETVRFSNVGAVVEATEPVLGAEHVGKWFALVGAGPSRAGLRQIHWSEVLEITDSQHMVLSTVPDANVTGQVGSFEAIRGSIEANSNLLELSTPISESLIGRYITVVGCGQQGAPSDFGTLTARVVAHSGDQITLSHSARLTRSDVAVVVAPGLYQGRSADFMLTPRGQNNDVTYHNMRLVGGDRCYMVPAVLVDNNAVDFEPGTKFHGSPPVGNNFAGNFAGVVYDVAETVNLVNCLVEHSRHSPRFGCHFLTGGKVQADVIGGVSGDFHSGTKSAEVYNDIQDSPSVAQFYHSAIRHRGFVGDQTLLRNSATGKSSQVLGGASSKTARIAPDGKAFPNRIVINGGPTADRPSPAMQFEKYFDTDLGHEVIYVNGAWVKASGT